MTSNILTKGFLKAVAVMLGIGLLLYFAYVIQNILIYLAVSAVIALIASPVNQFLRKRLKFPNTLAVVTTMILFIAIFFQVIGLFVPLIIQQGENLSLLNIEAMQKSIEQLLTQVNEYFLAHGIDVIDQVKNADLFNNLTVIPSLLNSVVGTLGSLSIGLFSIIFISFFLMKDTHIMEQSMYVLVPDKSEEKLRRSLASIQQLLSRYFIGLVFQISILFIIYAIVLASFGVENSVVIAFLAALLNLIPYIGPLIGGVIMMFLTMSSHLGQDFQSVILPTTLYVMLGYIGAQLIDNFISQPLIFSNSVKSHPLEIFLVILVSGTLFGPLGMVIAIPTYTALKVISKAFLADNKIVKSLTKRL
ncbi:MAG: AI-2E family transporter [Lutibacter sp.]|jgi:predicted PurR-regulated permease PerM|nr:AI-2E family transporter [Lutibacter sp.]